ncbi:hypothetical protein Tco_1484141 [Tanacetum coccineum]
MCIEVAPQCYYSAAVRFWGCDICKAEDGLRINPPNKINKPTDNDEGNEEHVTRRTRGFFFEPVTKKRTSFPKCYYFQKPRHNIGKCFEYMHDLKIAKSEKELREKGTSCNCDDCGSTSDSKEDEPEASSKA